MNGPYRELPTRPAPSNCEICDHNSSDARCPGCSEVCRAIDRLLPTLELPVVLVAIKWSQGGLFAGAGLVLVDRWRKVAQCCCRIPGPKPDSVMRAIARARAELWAPGAFVALGNYEMEHALAESLMRTPAHLDRAICSRFRREFDRAISCAEDGRYRHAQPGSMVWDPPDWPLELPA